MKCKKCGNPYNHPIHHYYYLGVKPHPFEPAADITKQLEVLDAAAKMFPAERGNQPQKEVMPTEPELCTSNAGESAMVATSSAVTGVAADAKLIHHDNCRCVPYPGKQCGPCNCGVADAEKLIADLRQQLQATERDRDEAAEENIRIVTENGKLARMLQEIAEQVAQSPTATGLQANCVKDHSLIRMAIQDAQDAFSDTVKRERKQREAADARIREMPEAQAGWYEYICGACQLMDSWKSSDPEIWTEWDQKIRDGLSKISVALKEQS
jgi:regulator of replication initiation timing